MNLDIMINNNIRASLFSAPCRRAIYSKGGRRKEGGGRRKEGGGRRKEEGGKRERAERERERGSERERET